LNDNLYGNDHITYYFITCYDLVHLSIRPSWNIIPNFIWEDFHRNRLWLSIYRFYWFDIEIFVRLLCTLFLFFKVTSYWIFFW